MAPFDDLWISQNPRFGVVRHVVVQGEYVAIFDDLNSDLREVALTILRRSGTGWDCVASQDDCGYPRTETFGETDEHAWALTRDPWRRGVPSRIRDALLSVEPDSAGWYLAVVPPDDEVLG